MSDPVLEYVKSIDQNTRILSAKIDALMEKHDKRIDDLEDSQAQMRGAAKVVIAIATGLSGILSWVVAHVWKV